MSLAGKKIVITGAAGGLGAGVAQVAFDQGAELVLLDVADGFTSELGQAHSVDLLDARRYKRYSTRLAISKCSLTLPVVLIWGPAFMRPKMRFGVECLILMSLHYGRC